MSRASLETYNRIVSEGILSERRLQTLRAVIAIEEINNDRAGFTHNEIAKQLSTMWTFPIGYRHNVVARLCELEEYGVICRSGYGKCPISGEACTFWATVDAMPVKVKKDPKKITSKQVIANLRLEIEQLKTKLKEHSVSIN